MIKSLLKVQTSRLLYRPFARKVAAQKSSLRSGLGSSDKLNANMTRPVRELLKEEIEDEEDLYLVPPEAKAKRIRQKDATLEVPIG